MKPECQIIHGDCRAELAKLPEKSVHCTICSPPYWGLRCYQGVEPSVWGDPSTWHVMCHGIGHEWDQHGTGRCMRGIADPLPDARCGAWYGLLGLEPTIDQYVRNITECFRAVKRVLRDDGTLFLNLGDSYGKSSASGPQGQTGQRADRRFTAEGCPATGMAKQLIGQPWRVAFALQADGWILRSDIIWHKPNPMPESVSGSAWVPHKVYVKGEDGETEYAECPGCEICNPNDGYVLRWGAGRPTNAHEHLFLLTKKPKYYYDAEAVREKATYGRREHSGRWISGQENQDGHRSGGGSVTGANPDAGRSKRSVWTIPTEANPEAHFASFPRKLVLPCILAGTSEKGCCLECGTPWVRVVEKGVSLESGSGKSGNVPDGKHAGNEQATSGSYDVRMGPVTHTKTLGWEPGCTCLSDDTVLLSGEPDDGVRVPFESVPCTVLDPFVGSGTAGIVATQQGRNFIGIDASAEYCAMARRRIANPEPEPEPVDAPGQFTMFEEVPA